MPRRTLVWFKRDLREIDHAPLAHAAGADAALGLYVVEPDWIRSPEFDPQHLTFALECLRPLAQRLVQRGLPVCVHHGGVIDALDALHREFPFDELVSHEETGPGWTWTRDRAVAGWARARGIRWIEFPQTGVIRRLGDRRGWAVKWLARMNSSAHERVECFRPAPVAPGGNALLPADFGQTSPARPLPPAGEDAAWSTLTSFLAQRGRHYRSSLSSPSRAQEACSRLSSHLAFGTISMRCVHQATEQAIAQADDTALRINLRAFASRLRWHCHFIQKLEDEPVIEFRNFARNCDGLRPGDLEGGGGELSALDRERLERWQQGLTGFPMVDACMRSLCATGWLNFRMRAMLVSFASYHLWLHWRDTGLFLARQFLDFEAGIHWSQMQMQSGTTGINTLRIYSPTKQAADQDPDGHFIRQWVPEWGTSRYPAPVVDEREALARAKEELYGLRATEAARLEAEGIQQRHGSRKAGLPPTGKRRRVAPRTIKPEPPAQGELF
jgi:deoxyribodipyrimidine photo-lyase